MSKKLKSGQTYDKHYSLLKDEGKNIYIYTRTHGTRHAHTINIETPYNKDFIEKIKSIARWMKKDKVWTASCDFDTKRKVCQIVDEVFKTSLENKLMAHKEASAKGASAACEAASKQLEEWFAQLKENK